MVFVVICLVIYGYALVLLGIRLVARFGLACGFGFGGDDCYV